MFRADNSYTVIIDENVKALRSVVVARGLCHTIQSGAVPRDCRDRSGSKASDRRGTRSDRARVSFLRGTKPYARIPPGPRQSGISRAQFNEGVSLVPRASARRRSTAITRPQSRSCTAQVDPKLDGVRQAMEDMLDATNKSIDDESDALTVKMHRAVFVTWLVALLGLTGTAAFAVYIVQSEVVNLLQKFRGHILDVAEERCDKPIPYQDRTDEIGEMSRALQTLQNVAN